MVNLLDIFLRVSRKHLHDDRLLAWMDGELPLTQARQVQRHLEQCWSCRARHGRLQSVIHGFVEYSNEVIAPYLPPPSAAHDRFLAVLDAELAGTPPRRFAPALLFRPLSEYLMHPALVSALIVVFAGVLLTVVWRNAARTHIAPEQLLLKSERAEQLAGQQSGVAYQKVEIRTPHHVLERAIYHDLTNRRKPVQAKLTASDAAIRSRLESAGVDWQNPLSPSDFAAWRGHVRIVSDQIKRTAPGEWTLMTDTDDSTVRQSSLTIREADFHAVSRRAVFRDSEEIVIAELNYDVLPWSAVNEALFEPLHAPVEGSHVAGIQTVLRGVLPSHKQLETAELEAQIALMKLHANDGEEIRVETGSTAVHVRGIVDTDRRKREIADGLSHIALVKPELQSLEEVEREHQGTRSTGPVEVHATDLQPSPLEKFLSTQSVPAEQAVLLSRTLTQTSITMDREARALSMLEAKYNRDQDTALSKQNQNLLTTLRQKHLTSLLQALASEEAALTPYATANDFGGTVSGSLPELAARNHRLCDGLVAGTSTDARSATEIFHDLVLVTAQIRRTLNVIQQLPPQP